MTFDFDLSFDSMKEYLRALNEDRIYNTYFVKSKTGLDCARFLTEYCCENNIKFPKYAVHSANHFGKQWIEIHINEHLRREKLNGPF